MAESNKELLNFNKSKTPSERLREEMGKKGLNRSKLLRLAKGTSNSSSGLGSNALTSNFLQISEALEVDPDKLLGVTREPLSPEIAELFAEISELDEEDKWLVVDLLRGIINRKSREK